MMGDQNLSDPRPVDGALSLALIRLVSDEPSCSCISFFFFFFLRNLYQLFL